jgi:GNAT superfamily N-acetyltransferase
MRIERATSGDVDAMKVIANQYKNELGFVNKTALFDSVLKGFVNVARLRSGEVVGFVEYNETTRGVNKGYSVIYHLAVDRAWLHRGIGRLLVYSVPAPLRLKVTADNPAHTFYERIGLKCISTESGRKRPLHVYEMNLLCVHVQGNNRRFPKIAAAAGMAYGTRHTEKARGKPFMLDIDWQGYDWREYMEQVNAYQPVCAMAADYERPDQRRQLYQQIRDLKAAGVLRVMVAPKFVGAVAHIPSWCVVALSVPSQYAGWLPDVEELRGRRVHLLGGSPRLVRDLLPKLRAVGARVLSYDYNAHDRAAQSGVIWRDGQWWRPPVVRPRSKQAYYDLIQASAANIRRDMNAISPTSVQLPLFTMEAA